MPGSADLLEARASGLLASLITADDAPLILAAEFSNTHQRITLSASTSRRGCRFITRHHSTGGPPLVRQRPPVMKGRADASDKARYRVRRAADGSLRGRHGNCDQQ